MPPDDIMNTVLASPTQSLVLPHQLNFLIHVRLNLLMFCSVCSPSMFMWFHPTPKNIHVGLILTSLPLSKAPGGTWEWGLGTVTTRSHVVPLCSDPGGPLRAPVLGLPAAGFPGAAGLPVGRSPRGPEPRQEEALPGREGRRGPGRRGERDGATRPWWKAVLSCL